MGRSPAFTANYACWALMCLSEPSPAGCAGRPETLSLPSVGWLFCTITVKPLPPWTSSSYPPAPSTCSTASLLLATTVEKSCTSITQHPNSSWIIQQLGEAFPYQSAPRFLLFDHDQKYGPEAPAAIRSMKITCVQTSIQSPWQNGVAERWVGSCRRDLLDHVIALNERHRKRLLSDYRHYYHEDRTHLGLGNRLPAVGIVPYLMAASWLSHASGVCTTVTNGPLELSSFLYMLCGSCSLQLSRPGQVVAVVCWPMC